MRVALVALVVVLAGCPAFGSSGTPTAELTPAPVPDVETYPPGVTRGGVTSPERLAEAHARIVSNASYTLVSNRTIRYANGSLASDLDVRLRLAADRQYHVRVATAGPRGPVLLGSPPAQAEFWSNGSVYVRYLRANGQTRYNQFEPVEGFAGTWRYWRSTVAFGGGGGNARQTFRDVFEDIPTEIRDSRTVGNTSVYRLVGDSARSITFAKTGTGPVHNVSLVARVDETGLVRRFELSYDTTVSGTPVHVDWTVRYLNVGNTTAERPPWFDRAVD